MAQNSLAEKFNKFVGQELPVTLKTHTTKLLGKEYKEDIPAFDSENDTLRDIRSLAQQCGLHVVFTPIEGLANRGYDETRLNIQVAQGSDQKWRITNKPYIG